MARARLFPSLLPLLVLGAAALLSTGCGEDAPPVPVQEGGAVEEWSPPARVSGMGSPDGEESVRSAESLLADLRARVAEGRGHADPTFQKSVQDVASVLWDVRADPATLAGAQQHMQIAAIAGEVSRWLADSEGARTEREKSNPTDVAIHDAFLAAAAKGPGAYRLWCAAEGGALLTQHREARYRKLFPDRVPPKRADGPESPADR